MSTDLTGDCDLLILLIADGTMGTIRIVEFDGHTSFSDTSLTAFVNQLLQ